jgi:hypothetical protein
MRGFLHWRGTPQRFDPITARSLYPLIGLAMVAILVYGTVRTVLSADEITQPVLAAGAILFVTVATVTVLVSTDPVRTPVGPAGFAVAVSAIVLASTASSAGAWASSNVIWDGWGPLAVGVLLLCYSEFRPGRDLALATALAALAVGITTALESAGMPELVSPLTSGIISATPVILFGSAAAVFSYRMSLSLSQAVGAVARDQGRLSRRVQLRLRETLRESGRDALAPELVPFLERIVSRGEVTEADVRQARRISAVLRSEIIVGMGLPWLERMARASRGALEVRDPSGYSEELPLEQTTALRALLTALLGAGLRVRVVVTASGPRHSILVRAEAPGGEQAARYRFGAFITVMNAVFTRSSVSYEEGELRLLHVAEAG